MRIAVVGLGLIGGSIALAARERAGAEVSGFDCDPNVREAALAGGVVDSAAGSAVRAVARAQAAFVAVPVGALAPAVGAVLEHAPADCVVTDVGSTKRAIVAAHSDPRFVGGHPLAGSERSGLGHARADMFEAATWYLTPTATTPSALRERLFGLIAALGAHPRTIDPAGHDRIVATVSHLPHVLANVLVAQAEAALPAREALSSAGPSFRDATRVAGAPGEVWTDIYVSNADLLAASVEDMIVRLADFRAALLVGDRRRIAALGETAAAAREDRRWSG